MGFFDWMGQFLPKNRNKGNSNYTYSRSYGSSPLANVYEDDYVLAAIHAITSEVSKMVVKSVLVSKTDVKENKDSINRLFFSKPNELMTMRDMLEWTSYQLETKMNAYWYPVFEESIYTNGRKIRKLLAIYPLNSTIEEMVRQNDEWYIVFQMDTGTTYKILYKDVIHFRKHFGKNYYFGSVDRTRLLERLNIIKETEKLLPKAIAASLELKGVIVAKSQMARSNLDAYRDEFEASMAKSTKGIVPVGVDGEFTAVNNNPQIVDKDLLKAFKDTVNDDFGVSDAIIAGKGTENDWNSLYQRNVEPFKIQLEQAATQILFTDFEREQGKRIKVYDKLVQNFTMETRLRMVELLGQKNYLSRSEQRELIGYEPDGGPDRVSLNFVNEANLDEYQLQQSKSKQKG
ncbi:MAG: phage portal protein [Acholeplasmataceae bacterium]